MQINKAFWRKNSLAPMSFAQLTYTKMRFARAPETEGMIEKMAYQEIPAPRQQQIDRERAVIEQLAGADDVVKFMRGEHDVLNQSALVKKAVAMQEEVMPILLRRFLTSLQDSFVETAAFAFAAADDCYARQLYELYPQINYIYAQTQACIVFGAKGMEDASDFLLEEYERFQREYPEEPLKEGPLLALHVLHGKL